MSNNCNNPIYPAGQPQEIKWEGDYVIVPNRNLSFDEAIKDMEEKIADCSLFQIKIGDIITTHLMYGTPFYVTRIEGNDVYGYYINNTTNTITINKD